MLSETRISLENSLFLFYPTNTQPWSYDSLCIPWLFYFLAQKCNMQRKLDLFLMSVMTLEHKRNEHYNVSSSRSTVTMLEKFCIRTLFPSAMLFVF